MHGLLKPIRYVFYRKLSDACESTVIRKNPIGPGEGLVRSAGIAARHGFTPRVPLLRIDQLKRTQPPPHILAALLFVLRSTTGTHLRARRGVKRLNS